MRRLSSNDRAPRTSTRLRAASLATSSSGKHGSNFEILLRAAPGAKRCSTGCGTGFTRFRVVSARHLAHCVLMQSLVTAAIVHGA